LLVSLLLYQQLLLLLSETLQSRLLGSKGLALGLQ
jgi:hypothetical protein